MPLSMMFPRGMSSRFCVVLYDNKNLEIRIDTWVYLPQVTIYLYLLFLIGTSVQLF